MRLRFTRSVSLITLRAAAALSTAQDAGAQTFQGPSSSQTPYVVPSAPGWAVASLITTGDFDKAGAYRTVGIPDGLGALGAKIPTVAAKIPTAATFWAGNAVGDAAHTFAGIAIALAFTPFSPGTVLPPARA